jgi:hypothetical protein
VEPDRYALEKWRDIRRTHPVGRIPIDYLRGSERQRMALLTGLLDMHGRLRGKDANARRNPQDEFGVYYQYNRDLTVVLEVAELVRTLGWPAYIYRADLHAEVRWWPQKNIFPNPTRAVREAHRTVRVGQPLQAYLWSLYDAQAAMGTLRRVRVDSPYGLFAAGRSFLPVIGDDD